MNLVVLSIMIGMVIPVHLMSFGGEENIILYDKPGNSKNPESVFLQINITIIPEEVPITSSTIQPEELSTMNSTISQRKKHRLPPVVGYMAGKCAMGSAFPIIAGLWNGKVEWDKVLDGCIRGVVRGTLKLNGRKKRSSYAQEKKKTLCCELISLGFLQSDRNGNNRLEFSEIRYKNLTGIAAVKFFSSKDTNKNGLLEPKEVHPCLTESSIAQARKIKACPKMKNRNVPVKKYTAVF